MTTMDKPRTGLRATFWPSTINRRLLRRVRVLKTQHWARTRLRLQDAVILDTETTDLFGEVVQLSVIDLRGQTLLCTLVRAQASISAAATAIHGIRDVDLLDAPSLGAVAPQLLEVTAGRQLLAYNAPYDRDVLTRGLVGAGVDPAHLADQENWACLMRARSAAEGRGWVALDGPHHALGDCLATLEVLHAIARQPA